MQCDVLAILAGVFVPSWVSFVADWYILRIMLQHCFFFWSSDAFIKLVSN